MLILLLAITGMVWNVENFVDWTAQTDGTSDIEFSAGGGRHWTRGRFYRKCGAVAKTVLAAADRYGSPPDFIAMEEIENAFVVRQLCRNTPLSKFGYEPVHFDSYDHRGIDCALLYRRGRLKIVSAKPCRIHNPDGSIRHTRDILLTVFLTPSSDTIAVLVNHHPSKVGSSGEEARALVMGRLSGLRDSLSAAGIPHIIAVGDFNDDIWSSGQGSPQEIPGRRGTIKYNGAWEKIDGHLGWGVRVREEIFDFEPLLTMDRAFGGMKPLRTYSGPQYLGGVSDHLPLYLTISY